MNLKKFLIGLAEFLVLLTVIFIGIIFFILYALFIVAVTHKIVAFFGI